MTDDFWAEWDELNTALRDRHPFTDSRFVRCLLRYFGTGGEFVVSCRRGGRLRAGAILVRDAGGLWSSFLPSQTALGPVLLPDVGVALEMVENLPGLGLSIDFLCQDPLYSPFSEDLVDAGILITPYADTVWASLEEGFGAYWAGRSKNVRKNVARYIRRLEAAHLEPVVSRIRAVDELGVAVGRYGEIESRGWKGRAGTAVHPDNVQGRFYAAVMEAFGATGDAEVYELWVEDRVAAMRLVIGNGSFRTILKTTYDEELRDYAPSHVLRYRMLELMAGDGGPQRVEFYTKATEGHDGWASGKRRICHARVFRWAGLKGTVGLVKGVRSWIGL